MALGVIRMNIYLNDKAISLQLPDLNVEVVVFTMA